jgi:hypothetical protein
MMTESVVRPVVVFHAKNEFEAQMARDALSAEEVPVLHLPSLTTGLFGMMQTTRVAVPEDCVEEALEVLAEAGFTGGVESMPRGLNAFGDAVRDAFPVAGKPGLGWRSPLLRVILGVALLIVVLVAAQAIRGR